MNYTGTHRLQGKPPACNCGATGYSHMAACPTAIERDIRLCYGKGGTR